MKRRALLQTAAAVVAVPTVAAKALASSPDKPQHLRAYLYADDIKRLKRREPKAVERVLTTVEGVSAWGKVEFVAGHGCGPHAKEDIAPAKPTTIVEARRALIQAFVDDPDFRDTYVANIACCLMDEQARGVGMAMDMRAPEVRNRCAELIMDHLFNPRELTDPTG